MYVIISIVATKNKQKKMPTGYITSNTRKTCIINKNISLIQRGVISERKEHKTGGSNGKVAAANPGIQVVTQHTNGPTIAARSIRMDF